MTQYDMKVAGEIGLLKMDFLGLANLTILGQRLREHHAGRVGSS